MPRSRPPPSFLDDDLRAALAAGCSWDVNVGDAESSSFSSRYSVAIGVRSADECFGAVWVCKCIAIQLCKHPNKKQ